MPGRTSPARVVAGVLRRDGHVLLCHRRRDRASWPDVWDLPGGHVDGDESMAEALVRELEEELGVQVEAPGHPPWMTVVAGDVEVNLYLVDRWVGEPRNSAPEEHDEIGMFAAADFKLLELAHPSYIEILQQALTAPDGDRVSGD